MYTGCPITLPIQVSCLYTNKPNEQGIYDALYMSIKVYLSLWQHKTPVYNFFLKFTWHTFPLTCSMSQQAGRLRSSWSRGLAVNRNGISATCNESFLVQQSLKGLLIKFSKFNPRLHGRIILVSILVRLRGRAIAPKLRLSEDTWEPERDGLRYVCIELYVHILKLISDLRYLWPYPHIFFLEFRF